MTATVSPDDALRVVVVACSEPFPTDGDYVRRFYMSQVGPTSTALLQLLASEGPRSWKFADLATRLGVGNRAQNHANNPLGRAVDRLTKFRLIEPVGDGRVFVRSHLPRLESHQLARMGDELRREHAAYMDAWIAAAPLAEAKP